MAKKLNEEFRKDPLNFLLKYNLSVVDGVMRTGPQRVGFSADQERVLLRRFDGEPNRNDNPLDIYFLLALPDAENHALNFGQTDRNYFFTSTLSGCQVLIYGPDKKNLSIQHNNDLKGVGEYERYFAKIPENNINVRVHNGGMYDITQDDIGNIVGVRNESGWNFYFQKIQRDQHSNKKTRSVTKLT